MSKTITKKKEICCNQTIRTDVIECRADVKTNNCMGLNQLHLLNIFNDWLWLLLLQLWHNFTFYYKYNMHFCWIYDALYGVKWSVQCSLEFVKDVAFSEVQLNWRNLIQTVRRWPYMGDVIHPTLNAFMLLYHLHQK